MTTPAINPFAPAVRAATKLKAAIDGPSGSGKTEGALWLASAICAQLGGRTALIDTEPLGTDAGAASLYADRFTFDTLLVSPANPATLNTAIDAAIAAKYSVLIIDSLSKAWQDVLDRKEQRELNDTKANRFTLWGIYGPEWERLMKKLLEANLHVIATMRSKQAYVQEGQKIHKLGLQPQVRDGAEYEFSLVFSVNMAHKAQVSKGRGVPWTVGENGDLLDLRDPRMHQQLLGWLNLGGERQVATPVARHVSDEAAPAAPQLAAPWNQDPMTLTLAAARALPLLGSNNSWGGMGGRPLGEVGDKMLERVRSWMAERLEDTTKPPSAEQRVKFELTLAAIALVSQGAGAVTEEEGELFPSEGEQRPDPTPADGSPPSSAAPAAARSIEDPAPTRTLPTVTSPSAPSDGPAPGATSTPATAAPSTSSSPAKATASRSSAEATPIGIALMQLRHIVDAPAFPAKAREYFTGQVAAATNNVTKVRNLVALAAVALRIGEVLSTPEGQPYAREVEPRWSEQSFYTLSSLDNALQLLRTAIPEAKERVA